MPRNDRSQGPDEPREEYDFSAGERGRYAARARERCNVVVLEPDVAAEFHDSAAVNRALRDVLRAERRRTRRPRR
jgi:hypothetical protein